MPGDAVRVEIEGLAALTASLAALKGDLADIAPAEAARTIGAAAQARAPKRSGRLASSMSSTAGNGVVKVSFGAPHAGAHNFGTGPRSGLRGPHNIRASRFLTGTVSDKESAWIKAYTDDIQDQLDEVKGA
jgi:phage gpG-like protein